ncbi:MAG TPA: exosortase system-associated protein, TIGR04073 family [Nitrosomonas sp.]|uniref:exosortase system-associated protein, TIGR04073 family n=1 Tax=Nitrosomonas sp. TaxID=42353 RepID=UPI00208D61D9|nr:exosortase system-associated protein, TIGR04073 family [Nitrosomonas sp.]GJL74369.1 MAG: hypothetical protein NMNS02_04750 [Nitrosomonas sp.]HNP25553.1 exosortase system-associated protein, TIGR04073 family [Nitrosomonas sp.]
MKKTIQILIILVTLSLLPNVALAHNYPTKVGEKLGNGIANAVTGVVEIPKTMIITGRRHGATYGMTAGFFTGLFHTVGRSVTGALDIATFLIPTTPIVKPNYIWDNFDRETTYTAWQMR